MTDPRLLDLEQRVEAMEEDMLSRYLNRALTATRLARPLARNQRQAELLRTALDSLEDAEEED